LGKFEVEADPNWWGGHIPDEVIREKNFEKLSEKIRRK
jgi:hypothetical protein